jgi:hypothetical protein
MLSELPLHHPLTYLGIVTVLRVTTESVRYLVPSSFPLSLRLEYGSTEPNIRLGDGGSKRLGPSESEVTFMFPIAYHILPYVARIVPV